MLTEPVFAICVKDLFKHTETQTINDINLLKVGKHFRFDEETKFVVGRSKNEMIKAIALLGDILFKIHCNMGQFQFYVEKMLILCKIYIFYYLEIFRCTKRRRSVSNYY